jgi:hypothetical protein
LNLDWRKLSFRIRLRNKSSIMACPTIWLPVGCKFQTGMDGFSYANPTQVFFSLAVE